MQFKRAVVMSLAACLALGLSACSGKGGEKATDGASTPSVSPTAEVSKEADANSEKASESSEAASDKESDKTAASGVKKDFENWTLPTDSETTFDPLLFAKGEQVAMSKCLVEKGSTFTLPEVEYKENGNNSFYEGIRKFARFSPETAEQIGYRPPIFPEGSKAYREALMKAMSNFGSPESQAVVECFSTLYTNHPFLLPTTGNQDANGTQMAPGSGGLGGQDLSSQVNQQLYDVKQISKDPEVSEAISKWGECMKAAGHADLPASPKDMPPPDHFLNWIKDAGGPMAIFNGQPVEEEKALAKQDALCRDSSGFSEAYYNKSYDLAVEKIASGDKTITSFNEAIKEKQDKIKEFINSQ